MTEATGGTVEHDRQRGRFSVREHGHEGYLDYRMDGGVMDIRHTIVPQAIGGRGIAGRLVRTALDFARAEGHRVRPSCEYAAAWMARHPDYDDLRAG